MFEFTNELNFLESSCTLYPLCVLKIVDVTILYSHKVFKTCNHHLIHKHKFTVTAVNNLHIHFIDRAEVRHSPLYYVLLLTQINRILIILIWSMILQTNVSICAKYIVQ